MSSPRVLVVSGSAGHGHVMAARALTTVLRRRHAALDVVHVDAVAKTAHWYRRTYRWSYVRVVDRHPLLWRKVYESTDRQSSSVGHWLSMAGGRRFIRLCMRWKPHVIVCTHFLAPELLAPAIRSGRIQARLQAVVTDHDIHRIWYWPEISRYYVASELVQARLALRYGVPESKIAVTGIPVRPGFGRRHDKVAIRARYGLHPDRPIVLFLSGGFAAGPMRRSILGLWMERRDIQILAVCGRNERMRRQVAALPRPAGAVLHALGFVEHPDELMAISDLVVSKSGGITTSECMASGKPLFISASIAGQEERNADAVVEAGAGYRTLTAEEVRWRGARLLEDPKRLRAMSRAAKRMGRPGAAADISDRIAADLLPPVDVRPHFHGA